MANDQILESLQKIIRDEIKVVSLHVTAGGCKDIEEYRAAIGKIDGMMFIESELLDLDERLTHS